MVYGETDRCGLYTVTRKSGTSAVALNLLDPVESSGAVVKELKTSTGRTAVTGAAIPAAQPFWRWFVLGVLVLLLVEWAVYHRRIEI